MRYANRSSICSNVILWANFALQTHNKKRIQRETASSICYFEVFQKRGKYVLSNFGCYLGSSPETYDTICWSCYFSIDLFLPPSGSLTDVRWPKFVGFSTPELRFSLRTSSLFGQISGILAADTWQKQEHLTQNPWLCENVVDAGKKSLRRECWSGSFKRL